MIFISYRNADSLHLVDRLDESLTREFGNEFVFRDKSRLCGGDDWTHQLEENARTRSVMLVVIGPMWTKAIDISPDRTGMLRLLNPDDWVRKEITLALDAGKIVIPLLLDDTPMPEKAWLKHCDLERIHKQQGERLRSGDYSADLAKLVAVLRQKCPLLSPASEVTTSSELRKLAFERASRMQTLIPAVMLSKDPHIHLAMAHAKNGSSTPPIFYHWKQYGAHLHFVEMMHLSLLRKLSRGGYPVELLVSDGRSMTGQDKATLANKVKHLFGFELSYHSDCLVTHESSIASFGDTHMFFNHVASHIDDLIANHHARREADQSLMLRFWLRYIPYICRERYHVKAAIVLCWERHDVIYEVLSMAEEFYPALIKSPTYHAGGEALKSRASPLRGILRDPIDIDGLAGSISSVTNRSALADFRTLLTNTSTLYDESPQKQIYSTMIKALDERLSK